MKKLILAAALAALPLSAAQAGPISSACMASDRARGNRALCTCIQQVADMTLSASDQRMAAGFFRNPDRAQEIRTSDRQSHADFWRRYRSFGDAAEGMCAAG